MNYRSQGVSQDFQGPVQTLCSHVLHVSTDGKVCPCEKEYPNAVRALMGDLPSEDVSNGCYLISTQQNVTNTLNKVLACETINTYSHGRTSIYF